MCKKLIFIILCAFVSRIGICASFEISEQNGPLEKSNTMDYTKKKASEIKGGSGGENMNIKGAKSSESEPSKLGQNQSQNEEKPSYLLSEFSKPIFSFQLLRYISPVAAGASDLGECLYTMQQIKDGDYIAWGLEWKNTANRIYSFAKKSLSSNNLQTAKEAFFRSANYYLAADFYLPKGLQKLEIFEKARSCFTKGCVLSAFPFEVIKIPYENTYLPGYIFLAKKASKAKTIILNAGYDGSAEELYFGIGSYARKRGYNVVIFEGPGQGLSLIKNNLPFRFDWEKVIYAVVDFALTYKEVDPKAIALYGLSFGGYLTPRAAAYERRIKALIVNSPVMDFSKVMLKGGLSEKAAIENPKKFDEEIFQVMKSSPSFDFFMKDSLWKFGGGDSPSDWVKNIVKYRLEKEVEMIQCPTLVIDSEQDNIINREDAKIFYSLLKSPKKLISFANDTGAGLHCQLGSVYYSNEQIFDWLDGQFGQSGKK